ncbi:VOC family protein [Devosia algicola]|uniref:VOC family protein n=1 Tax=Devosia algicola TaxID=3026418 RepID=A0ABY7YJZ4_9HYPH|nr:VOC family protein [Devosia algicola]
MSALTILYVNDPAASAEFYAPLLGVQPTDQSAGFAMFVLPDGAKIGFWARDAVLPKGAGVGIGGGSEICIAKPDMDAVGACFEQWSGLGVKMIQEPIMLDFGLNFVAEDSDGHRLRVYHSAN